MDRPPCLAECKREECHVKGSCAFNASPSSARPIKEAKQLAEKVRDTAEKLADKIQDCADIPDGVPWSQDELDLIETALRAYSPTPSASGSTDAKDAARYRWLRDVSVPPHNFYLSVPDEFKDERYKPQQVDAAIDAAIGARAEGAAK